MSRVTPVDPAAFAADLAEALGHPTSEERVRLGAFTVWAHRPGVALAFLRLQEELDRATSLSPRLRELVRLRIAFHNRCRSCMAVRSGVAIADGMTDGAVCSLERPEEADDLTPAEKAALRYADLMATDHLSIDDAVFAQLREHFDEDAVIDLGIHIGTCVGYGRLAMSWDLVDDLPQEYRGDGTITPWSGPATVR
ncbi:MULTISPECIES: carboxymuconolactone decarboxylase family protein [unclassified Blastococcus]